ncbi:hypothetical protein [Singulisphaera sp. PoT]|uniref:hypothetical protein n=1 Tax=Singulisphaera sp. PoT TaxID=3411797 RepID=UPI003BF5A7AE
MRFWARGFFAALGLAFVAAPGVASACTKCHSTPCAYVPAPAPAYQCVTEMVPYQVNRVVQRIHMQPVTETIMVKQAQVNFVDRQRTVCRPVYDTTYVPKTITTCRPVSETTMVTQTFTVCKPVTTYRQVTEYCMQPTTQLVTVPTVSHGCGLCGKTAPTCGHTTVAKTCYTPVPVVKNVPVCTMVPEVQTRQVPVTTCRLVTECKTIQVPVTSCRIVSEVVNEKIPVTTFVCVPKTITRCIPVPVCETVTETCYRPVTRTVPVCAPAVVPAPQAAPAPSAQLAPSKQS